MLVGRKYCWHDKPVMISTRFIQSAAWPRVAPFALFILFMALGDVLTGLTEADILSATVDTRWLYPVKTVLIAALLIYFWRRYDELKLTTLPNIRVMLLSVIVGAIVFVLWINLDLPLLRVGDSAGYNPLDPSGEPDIFLIVARVLGAALIVPIMEELFWRSFLMRWLDQAAFNHYPPERTTWRAILITSALFATAHNLWFAALITGIIYGLLYRNTQTLWAPVIAHAVTNGLLAYWVLETQQWSFW